MIILLILLSFIPVTSRPTPLVEKIDLYDPVSGAYKGNEINRFGPDGRRLRWEINDATGKNTLLFFVSHDDRGREKSAVYFEDGSNMPSREIFTYSKNGRLRTTNYVSRSGAPADRTESDLDKDGREISKRYFRQDGTQYGAEKVFWNPDGTKKGWDFRYIGKEGRASFRYKYVSFDNEEKWIRRIKIRNGIAERIEVRTLTMRPEEQVYATPVKFGEGPISTGRSETSPSFSRDGKTMVFARYGDEWSKKDPFIANLGKDGWRAEPISGIGKIYNLAVSPDGKTVFYSKRFGEKRQLYRISKKKAGWTRPENLSEKYGIVGTYPLLSESGDLYFFDSEGPAGNGIYTAPREGTGFGKAAPVFVTKNETLFDPFTSDGKTILVSWCFDDTCNPGPKNGIWEIIPDGKGSGKARKIPNLPYAWGSQVVKPLGLFVYTDGDDILALPLRDSGIATSFSESRID